MVLPVKKFKRRAPSQIYQINTTTRCPREGLVGGNKIFNRPKSTFKRSNENEDILIGVKIPIHNKDINANDILKI